jgi:hypothetical protein
MKDSVIVAWFVQKKSIPVIEASSKALNLRVFWLKMVYQLNKLDVSFLVGDYFF